MARRFKSSRRSRPTFRRRRTTRKFKKFGRKRSSMFGKRRSTKLAEKPVFFKMYLNREVRAQGTATSNIVLNAVSSLPYAGGVTFCIADLGASKIAAWSALYEQIKLLGVGIRWIPETPNTGTTMTTYADPGGGQDFRQILVQRKVAMAAAFDPDDATTVTFAQLQQIARRRYWKFNKTGKMFIRPNILQDVNATVQRPIPSTWLDIQDGDADDLPHYAFKYALENNNTATPGMFNNPSIFGTNTTGGAFQAGMSDPAIITTAGKFEFTYYVACRRTVNT